MSHKSVLQECHLDICSFLNVFAFGFVGSILFFALLSSSHRSFRTEVILTLLEPLISLSETSYVEGLAQISGIMRCWSCRVKLVWCVGVNEVRGIHETVFKKSGTLRSFSWVEAHNCELLLLNKNTKVPCSNLPRVPWELLDSLIKRLS